MILCVLNTIFFEGVIKSITIRWAVLVVRVGNRGMHIELWWGDLMERNHSEHLGIDGRIILKLIFKTCNGLR
jgi:hypothetical protein